MNVILDQINAAGHTFVEFAIPMLVQSSLLILILLFADLLLRKKVRAGFRYWIWTLVLVKLALPASLSTPVSLGRWLGEELAVMDAGQMIAAYDTAEFDVDRQTSIIPIRPGAESPPPASAPAGSQAVPGTQITSQGIVFLVWLVVVMVMTLLLLQRTLYVRGLVEQAQEADDSIKDTLAHCCNSMGIRSKVGLKISPNTASPAVCRLLRPVILLPQNLLPSLDASQLRAVLMHELAHLKRFDLWVNLVQTFLQIIYFYHPLLWLANSIIHRAREQAVDEVVLVAMGEKAQEYLETLVNVAKLAFKGPTLSLRLIGVVESRNLFEWRIRTMLSRPIPKSARLGVVGTIVILAIATLLLPMAKAQEPKSGSKPTTEHDTETAVATAPVSAPRPIFRKTSIPGTWDAWDAQLSPDGKSMAFGRNGQLWIMPRVTGLGPDGPGAPQVVDTGGIGVGPIGVAWSADGQWMAFVGKEWVTTNNGSEENFQLYVVSAQGGQPRKVFEPHSSGIIWNRHISLSPNGKILAFASPEDRALRAYTRRALHVYTIPVEGGTPKRLVDVPAREPAFSPDGKWIAYVEDKNLGHGGGGLWVIPAEGGTARRVAETSNAGSPVWSPDGRMIAFVDYNLRDGIYIISLDENGAPVGAKITVEYPKEISGLLALTGWTPDNKIGVIFSRPFVGEGLYMLPLKGGPATLLTGGHCEGIVPRWSPDGKRIVYSYWVSAQGAGEEEADNGWLGDGTAWIPVEGGEATKIPVQTDAKMFRINWGGNAVSPDGKTIVFPGKAGERGIMTMHIWTLPIEGGRPTQLTHAPAPVADAYPCWSPDGKAIAFARCPDCTSPTKSFGADIFIVPAAGGKPRQLTSESDTAALAGVAWSPDGKLLAYFAHDGPTLRVIPAEGGESRIVAKLQRLLLYQGLAWSPDSQRIAFNDPPNAIKIVSLTDGHVEDVDPGVATTTIHHVDWSHDGEKLVFGARLGGGERELWLLENFLPAK